MTSRGLAPVARRRAALLLALAPVAMLPAAVRAQAATSAPAASIVAQPDGVAVRRAEGNIRVVALTDAILRIRIDRDGALPEDASWAVDAAVRKQRVRVTPTADGFATAALRVAFAPDGRMTITDPAGKIITTDAATPFRRDGAAFTLRKAMPQGEHYFGLGDKTGGLDRRGKSFVDWNTDAFGFGSGDDPIYKSIPFFIGVGGEGGSYGIFLDNSWRSWFDFGHRDDNVLAFGAPDGPVDYYVIAGPTTADVVRRYTDLTGKAPIVPQWALGYQQSRYSYMSADELRNVAARLRQERVPTDVLWLDIDWQDRNRPFTVDTKAFPDMKGLLSDLKRDGFKVVTITDLHVARVPDQGYRPYDEGTQRDAFVHRADGSVYVGPVWPGPSVFPDFTQSKVRNWYGTLFADQVKMGVAGAWNDMNEPAIFNTPTKTMPPDVLHRIDSDGFAARTAPHAEIHNVYGMENTRATYDGLRKLAPNERAFVMTRASYAGGQRYAVTWTGDNLATWDHLKLSVQQIINLGLSGFSYGAADVTGFAGGPSPELATRWFEIGAFYPVFRNHSAKGTPRVEPWVDGREHLAIRRRFIEERYRLMPYLYALADQNSRLGDPILRPVFYDYPSALRMSCDQSWTFTVGRSLLVAPPPRPDQPVAYDVCLPAGGWYDYWTGQRAGTPEKQDGGQIQSASQATGEAMARGDRVTETPRLDHLPVFVRAGTILPRQPLVQNTGETPKGALQLDVYPGEDCRGDLYADDGHSMAFRKGVYLRQQVRCTITPAGLRIAFDARQGRFRPWWSRIAIVVHGWQGAATVSGLGVSAAQLDTATGTIRFDLPDRAKAGELVIARR
ncbi:MULTISPECIES: TIM-barrel domain-containing protein [unclassified Sphingomonas]|jgi:alpha-glucosidase|uniref:glycoside hydrolase family 31 protein n=1 Tax=unclassified Sphingomonas TaxID=196159 RepID=UPI000E109C10|nr:MULTISPECIES: TIM-barrel domain-containing protein [unclassified Sphingomonas]AXJ94192.1 alpha-glucosidase [Sphingomonas sp. FARSPH]